ncbi:MAG: hypothetical protein KC729_16845, partial [Candidatus Eisenbacteria bacterium]|nr:hypothetical protein [Candidatus Eisenbacteria bacterium]
FSVLTPAGELRVRSISDLGRVLTDLGPIPVAEMGTLDPSTPGRIEARLAVHPLAPSMSREVRSLIADPDDADRREFSVGIGSLLRYLLRKDDDESWSARAVSPPFLLAELPRWAPASSDSVTPGTIGSTPEAGR